MKKNKLYTLVVLLFLVFLFNSCHKYPDGGWTNVAIKHLFGANKDMASKTWKLTEYEVNGIDSTSYLRPGNGVTNFQNAEVKFQINNARAHDYFYITKVYNTGFFFSNNKLSITFGNDTASQCRLNVCERKIFLPESTTRLLEWKVIKLTSTEFIISANANQTYKIILSS